MLKVVIVLMMIAVLVSLFTGLVFLIKDGGRTNRVVNSLAIRVGLSLALIALIVVALWHGDLTLNPTP
ncbi:MAG: twin transmembrane helix small protein [Marinobacter sp.]|nr:twin transmembrane helix small protein [Marinobacter sp.]